MPTAIPTSAVELEEMLSNPAAIKNIMNEGNFTEFINSYAATVINKDKSLTDQIRNETQIALADFLKEQRNTGAAPVNFNVKGATPVPSAAASVNQKYGLYNSNAVGAGLNDQFSSPAEFMQAIWHKSESLQNRDDLSGKKANARKLQNSFGSTIPADGGFLIPETLRSELLQLSLESGIVRPRARTIPMESLRVPIPMVDATSNATSVFGGIVCYWTEEGATLVESQASFGRVALEAKKLTGYAEIPNELVADATAFGAFFSSVFPAALAWYEDIAFLSGTGVGEPLGAFNSANAALVATAAEAGQTAATIVWENIVKMYSRMLPASLGNAVWICSIDTFPELATMALSVGTGGSAIWLNNGAAGPPMTILGRPVIFTEKTSALGTQGDISFVDLSYYLIGDRQMMQADSSPHYKFANDKTAFRIIERVDGRPWLQSAITPRNSGPTLSPFVQLATRS